MRKQRIELVAAFAPIWLQDEFDYFIDLLEWIADAEPDIPE